jgi:light-regulated signal transduction histidine kinase (bacteriophytochrome)
MVSHDLQEPLRKVQAFGDRLRVKAGDSLGSEAQDYLARVMNAAGRMQTLITDLLTLSRVATRAQPFSKVDLGDVVRDVLTDLEVRVEQTGGRVDVRGLPTIDAEPTQMRQLFQNLIGNALKFNRPGTPPVVTITAIETNGHSPRGWEVIVRDNGIGFDEQHAEQIFKVFHRLHSRNEYEGTGVGLAVCRKIVERHGGTIVAKSAAGEGARFVITFPEQRSGIDDDTRTA